MLAEQFEFCYGGQNYVIWTWKGDYLNLGAGGEVGIYKSLFKNGRHLYYVDKSLAMNMVLAVYNMKYAHSLDDLTEDDIVFTYAPDAKQWWITGFNPRFQNAKAKDLKLLCFIAFDNEGLYEAFVRDCSSREEYLVFIKPIKSVIILF